MREIKEDETPSEGAKLPPGRLYLRQARVDRHLELNPSITDEPEAKPQRTIIYGSLSLGGPSFRVASLCVARESTDASTVSCFMSTVAS
jgi:hypothetical protein